MPAGIIKTPNSGRGAGGNKDANSAKKTRSAEGKGSATSSGGKKLVQTRLPFKLITPGTGTAKGIAEDGASTTSASSLTVIDLDVVEPRKRKLSYGAEENDDEATANGNTSGSEDSLLRRSNSKENLAVGATATKKAKTVESEAEAMAEDVIALDDDDDSDPAIETDTKKPKQKEPTQVKIQIKLPLLNKRSKRRKSLKMPEEEAKPTVTKAAAVVASDSSDDIEELAEELNPQKKQKVAETSKAQEAKKSKRKKDSEDTKKSKEPPQSKNTEKPKEGTPENVEQSEVQLVSSSESESNLPSNTDQEMDVDDTETVNKITPEKEKPSRKSIPQVASVAAAAGGSESKKQDNLTPKQQRLLEQRRKAREEKEQKLQEERRLKQEEKEQREQQKKLERDQKEEQRRKERDEKEEQRRKEREERERKRQAEMDSKNEEKRKRNEAKEEIQRKKDEDRRRKEQEKEEAEQKKKRAAESFSKFFVQKQTPNGEGGTNCPEAEQNSCDSNGHQIGGTNSQQLLAFRPFQVKDDMVMAPVTRAIIDSPQRKQLDGLFRRDDDADDDEDEKTIGRSKRPSKGQLYLSELSLGKHKALKTQRDARLERRTKDEEEYDDVQIIDDLDTGAGMMPIVEDQSKQLPRMRAKYLHFADNRRPPYYGTWRKTTKTISARRPLAQDKLHFDYDLDSDCEWEEEEPGESLSASEDEKEKESEEESEEEYNEWYVPHGHLSDEELQNDGEMEDGNTREAQKAKLQVLQQEFAQEMKKQTKKIKPRLLGPVWLDENGKMSQLYPACFAQTIEMYGCWQLEPLTLEPPPEPQREEETTNPLNILQLDTPRIQQLIRLVHGNRNSKVFLISEFLEYLKGPLQEEAGTPQQYQLPSKSVLREKFDELATWQPIELTNSSETPVTNGNNAASAKKLKKPKKRLCWVVPEDMLEKYDLKALTLQNEWSYALTPKVKQGAADTSIRDISMQDESTPPAPLPPLPSSVSEETVESSPKTANPKAGGSQKKRAPLLMSVPRDQPIHGPTKNALISRYLRRQSDAKAAKTDKSDQQQGDDVVELSD
ncbi:chromatin assembly factor 1 subunit A-B [Drosophila tropicalis]|uniref:chromatin assembly factor 1 subunit A-B n=1 Tax=Drosophila tropicalis TaxID=46794 RepID=UPI0035ABEE2B